MILHIVFPFLLLFIVPRLQVTFTCGRYRSSKNIILLFFFVLTLIVICGLRDSGGADDTVYRLYYEKNLGGNFLDFFTTDKEPVFNLVKSTGYALGMNYKILFLAYSAIAAIFVVKGLENCFDNRGDLMIYIAGYLFLVFPSLFTVIRQSAAMAILFYMYSLKNPTWKKKILLWFLILCTHYGFAILLPFEIILSLKKHRFSRWFRIALPVVCVLIGSFVDLSGVISQITKLLGLYSYMNSSDNYNTETSGTALGVVVYTCFILYILKVCYLEKKYEDRYPANRYTDLFNAGQMMYLSLAFITMGLRWGNRISFFYLIFLPTLIVDVWKLLPIQKNNVLIRDYLPTFLLFLCYLLSINGILGPDGYVWSLNFI